MLKREITYEDFNGGTVTETHYFNLTRTELVELDVSYDDGLKNTIERIIETKDVRQIILEFKRLVLLAYGKRSDDGKRFIKNDEIREEFSQTAAYDALFMELATDPEAAAAFLTGIIPAELRGAVTQEVQDVPMNIPMEPRTVPLPPAPPTD